MADRLEEIEARALRRASVFTRPPVTVITADDLDWLISEIKRLREEAKQLEQHLFPGAEVEG